MEKSGFKVMLHSNETECRDGVMHDTCTRRHVCPYNTRPILFASLWRSCIFQNHRKLQANRIFHTLVLGRIVISMCVKVLFHSFDHVHVYCHFVMNMDICQIPMIFFVAVVVFDFICSNSAISLQLNMSLFEPYRSLSLLPMFFFPGIGHISLKMTTIVKYPYNQWGEKK